MGMILESTKAMGNFSVELRRDTFYLNQDSIIIYPNLDDASTGTLEIEYKDLPKLKAAIALIEKKRKRA